MLDREIAQRMDAYRGNPRALMQRYAEATQDPGKESLIDLLALQKVKSEMEAAKRNLQMQQVPPGGLPTVAQQREKEVMDMTRQEVAQQVGQTAQQQQQKQQAAMQQLMSGIARAPGAGNAMSPQAMAAGGIVAFKSGGASATYRGKRWEDLQAESDVPPPPEYPAYHSRLKRAFTRGGRKIDPDTGEPISFGEFLRLAEKEAAEQGAAAPSPARIPVGGIPGANIPPSAASSVAAAVPSPPDEPDVAEAPPPSAASSSASAPAAPPSAPSSSEEVGPPVLNRAKTVARPNGIAALLEDAVSRSAPSASGTGGITTNAPSASDAVSKLITQARGMTGADLAQKEADNAAETALERQRSAIETLATKASQRPMMSAEDLAARQAEITAARGRMQQEFDPESERLSQLIATLSAMGGRTSIGSMGAAGAQAAMGREAQREAARRERLKEISGMEENLRQRQEAERLGKFTSEQEAARASLAAYGDVAKLANDIAQGRSRVATELTTNAMRIAGQAGITDAQIAAEARNLAARLGMQGQELQIKSMIEAARVGVDRERLLVERDRAARLSDPQAMIDNYAQEYIAQGIDPVRARSLATTRYQREFRDVESRQSGNLIRLMSTPSYLRAAEEAKSRDPNKAAAAKREINDLITAIGLDPNSAEVKSAMSASTTRGVSGAGGLPLPAKQEDLKAGQLYNTARGLARWNGTQFILEGQ